MPLVADHPDGRIDSTITPDETWSTIHQRGAPLTCPECSGRMVAAESTRALRYFRHFRRPAHCDLHGETPTHRALKREVAGAVRAVPGWAADLEVSGEGWRADVLASGPDGRRIAWEVQVSGIRADGAAERTRRHRASGVETVWLPTRDRATLKDLPRALTRPGDPSMVYRFAQGYGLEWADVEVSLPAFVGGVCRGSVRWDRCRWTTREHAMRARANDARRREEAEQRAAAEAQYLADLRARMRSATTLASDAFGSVLEQAWSRARADGREQLTAIELAFVFMHESRGMDRRLAILRAQRVLAMPRGPGSRSIADVPAIPHRPLGADATLDG